jgi:hypothetical protein
LGQSRGAEEALDLFGGEAEPYVGLWGAHPFVGVLDGVGDRNPSAWPHDSGHLGEHAGWVVGVVKDHVRYCGVERVVVEW